MTDITSLISSVKTSLENANTLLDLQQIRAEYLGKKGLVTELLKNLGQLSGEERKEQGQVINQAKQDILSLIEAKQTALKEAELAKQLAAESIDVTLPGRGQARGSLHPVTKVQQRVEAFFKSIGFEIADGPEIEDQFHNFEALNMPESHPARDMQDTFYFPNGDVLRTHTSSVQIRHMRDNKPPFRVIAPGRVYRSDSDQTHTPMFNQVEGLMVDKNANFANLKAVLEMFMENFFEQPVEMRLRPSYFPFTEPSAEVDIRLTDPAHPFCGKWLEVLGCGMIHPSVLESVGVDSNEYSGWAFGCGMDRLAMLRYGIDDLRSMFESDVRFLRQFA
jgi:phenylalanyl-tRNA synthetase alpha chain